MRDRHVSIVGRRLAAVTAASMTLVLAACGSNPAATPTSTPRAPAPTPTATPLNAASILPVTQYGASGDGFTDNTQAFARAIAAAETAGGATVYVPPGRYVFNSTVAARLSSIVIEGAVGITLKGAGRDQSTLVETMPNKGLLTVLSDHSVVSDLTLDTQTDEGSAAMFVRANYTSLLHARVLGGSHAFALFYAGPVNATTAAPVYNVGNTVSDLLLNDLVCDDGFSWSFQNQSSISDVVHTGSRLALYVDEATTVNGYTYTPGTQQCAARNGFWLTPPDNNITIINFVSSGEGGKVGVIGPGGAGKVADNVTITGLTLTGTGDQVSIGDVRNLRLLGCHLGTNPIVVVAQQVAQATLSGCTFGGIVRRSPPSALVAISVAV
jgi:hypothetical protein